MVNTASYDYKYPIRFSHSLSSSHFSLGHKSGCYHPVWPAAVAHDCRAHTTLAVAPIELLALGLQTRLTSPPPPPPERVPFVPACEPPTRGCVRSHHRSFSMQFAAILRPLNACCTPGFHLQVFISDTALDAELELGAVLDAARGAVKSVESRTLD
jgi:hypothetical protein